MDRDTPGVEIQRVPRWMHTFVYEHPEFTYTDVFVPDANVLGAVGEGYDITRSWFTEERLMIAARTIGAAERALGAGPGLGGRTPPVRLSPSPTSSSSRACSRTARSTSPSTARTPTRWPSEADSGTDRKTLHAKAALAKLSSTEASGRVVDRCLQIFGGRGYDRTYPVERLYRELRADRIWEGTSEIQRIIIAGELRKRGLGFLNLPVAVSG